MLLTPHFWTLSLLWTATSLLLPAVVASLCNLRAASGARRHVAGGGGVAGVLRYPVDPLMFSVAKALLTWTVYGCGYRFGVVGRKAAYDVEHAMFGGWEGVVVGCGVGGVMAVYEAVLRK